MGKKIYIGNLPFSATDEHLAHAFSQYGEVASARVVTDRVSGRSRGFGFVEMANDEEANSAISQLNGAEMDGRALTVNEARPQAPRESRGDFGGGGGGRRGMGGGGRPNAGGGFRGGRGRF